MSEELIAAARTAAQYECDDQGSPWCGGCHRTVADCDREPEKHFVEDLHERLQSGGSSYRTDVKMCPGHQLRMALRAL